MKRADEIRHAVVRGNPGKGKFYKPKNSRNANVILVSLFSLFLIFKSGSPVSQTGLELTIIQR